MPSVSTGSRRPSIAALGARRLELKKEVIVSRKELSAAAREAMEALQLSPRARLVLDRLVGCYGETLIAERVLVWPSNDYLVARTGLSERSVRYALAGLVKLGLVVPKDSANGKRFAVRGSSRQVIDAFGFDLTPVYARRGEWALAVRAQQEASDELRSLFEEITICRRAVEQVVTTLATDYAGVDRSGLENALGELRAQTPRRSVSADRGRISELLRGYRALRENAERVFYEAGNAGNDCRHIESKPLPLKPAVCKEEASDEAGPRQLSSLAAPPPSLKLILEACPALASLYPEPITDDESLIKAAKYLRSTIGAHRDAWVEASERLGSLRAAVLLAITLQIHDDDVSDHGVARIKNPGGYFRALARKAAEGRYQMEVELLALRRRHLE